MVFLCESCRLYFPRQTPNCPQCGGRPLPSAQGEGELKALGYRLLPLPRLAGGRAAIEDEDVLESLRRDYRRQYQPPPPEPVPPPQAPPAPEEDFFAQAHREPPEEGISSIHLDPAGPEPGPEPGAWEAPAPRAGVRRPGSLPLGELLFRVPWRLLGTLVFLAAIVGLLAAIWSMRGAIVQGLLSIFASMLPFLLGFYLLWRALRGWRRR